MNMIDNPMTKLPPDAIEFSDHLVESVQRGLVLALAKAIKRDLILEPIDEAIESYINDWWGAGGGWLKFEPGYIEATVFFGHGDVVHTCNIELSKFDDDELDDIENKKQADDIVTTIAAIEKFIAEAHRWRDGYAAKLDAYRKGET